MLSKLHLLFAAGPLLCPFSNIWAAAITNTAVADTYFEAYGSERKNFGNEPVLRIDQWEGRRAFLRFDLADIPQEKRILQATLKLHIIDVGFNEQGEMPGLKTCVALYDVVTPWTENGLTYAGPDTGKTWSQGPGLAAPKYGDVGPLKKPDIGVDLRRAAIALDPAGAVKNGWLDLNITDFVRSRVRAKQKEINLVLQSSTLGRSYTFSSREAADPSLRPCLLIDVGETMPDFTVPDVFLTDWKTGDRVEVKALSASGKLPANFSWAILTNGPARQWPARDVNAAGGSFSFVPEGAGTFDVAVRAANESGGPLQEEVATVDVLSVPLHPRLYVTPATLERMRRDAGSGERLAKAFLDWTSAGNSALRQDRFHDMSLNEGCENNALAWLITGEAGFLSNSIAYANRIMKKPMREHFEDVHAATFLGASWVHAMALHYDWCYERLTPEHRQRVVDWLLEAADWGWVRSGAPIAHNDGGARQCLLSSAALALLGDHPQAPRLYRRSRDNFEQALLPWLNDGGRGGRSGDGGEYEGLHGFYIVKFAWMSQTGTGVDVFNESPFFFNRLRHVMFGWYPRPLVEKSGAFSMREYYSPSGDHTRMGYVGDTQPYQSAAALCARFAETQEAQGVRWLAGEWPTRWMQYTLRWPVLGGFSHIPSRQPESLAFLDPGCNTVYARSDWSDDATWVLFENAPYVSAHGSLDSGTFEIFKGDLLAARTGNLDHANVGAAHTMNYMHRTIAANCLLVHDPNEKWKGFLGGAEGRQDGGGQRTNFPLGSSPDAATYEHYREVFQRGQITRFNSTPQLVYAMADLTPAYNSPHFHGAALNQPKVTDITRQLLYLRELDALLVLDRVTSRKPEFKKTWLLHSLGDLDVADGQEQRISEGEFRYANATRAVIRHGWPKPVPSFGRCLSVTLLPHDAVLTKIGGREELPAGQKVSWPGDQWHGQHTHRHVKDFWVNGTNYPPGNPPETRWFGEPGSSYYVAGTPDETGGRGKWRLEVATGMASTNDVFFHVLCPRLGREGEFPSVDGVAAGPFEGALIKENGKEAAVFFSREREPRTVFTVQLSGSAKLLLAVADLVPGEYEIAGAGNANRRAVVGEDSLLVLREAAGERVQVRRLR